MGSSREGWSPTCRRAAPVPVRGARDSLTASDDRSLPSGWWRLVGDYKGTVLNPSPAMFIKGTELTKEK